jgi:hypothetical protein
MKSGWQKSERERRTPLSPTNVNVCVYIYIRGWQNKLKTHFRTSQNILDTTIFTDRQENISKTEGPPADIADIK